MSITKGMDKLIDRITELEAEIKQLRAERGWRLITEEETENRKMLMVSDGYDISMGWFSRGFYNDECGNDDIIPTLWQPLPAPPKE